MRGMRALLPRSLAAFLPPLRLSGPAHVRRAQASNGETLLKNLRLSLAQLLHLWVLSLGRS
jgi:hypothetical protein